jgi:hypothetical protein
LESTRWKSASLAINAIIRGLDLDQIAFRYDLESEPLSVSMSAWNRSADGSDGAVAFSGKSASA